MSRTERRALSAIVLVWVATAAFGDPGRQAGALSFGVDSGFVMKPFARDDPYSFGARAGAWLRWAPVALSGLSLGASAGLYGFRSMSDTYGPSRMWTASGVCGYSFPLALSDDPNRVSLTALGLELSLGYYERTHDFLGSIHTGRRLTTGAAAVLTLVDGALGSAASLALLVPLESRPIPLLEFGLRMGLWL